jgi:solute carrier family 25 (mitochondrial carnitine/acylcarnitine transporter), member 20/29
MSSSGVHSTPSSSSSERTTTEQPNNGVRYFSSTLSGGVFDYLCGCISGIGKVVAGYPFDTVKSRVQTGRFPNSIRAFWGTLRHEGPLAFYQGVAMPAVSVCFVGGIMFYVNGYIRRWIQPDPAARLTYSEMLRAGCGAGFAVGVVLTPMEVVKVRLQVSNRATGGHASVRAVLRDVRFRDLFSGATPTLIREVCTFGLFFPVNEYLKVSLRKLFVGKDSEHEVPTAANTPLWMRVVSAGSAGIVGWLPCYPVDVVKSRMQVVPQGTYRTWIHCMGELYGREGHRGLYKGLMPCLTRAFPAYAAQFLLFEYVHANW